MNLSAKTVLLFNDVLKSVVISFIELKMHLQLLLVETQMVTTIL